MEKQVAVIVGVGAVAAALVGGLGWKTLKSRCGGDKLSKEDMELRKEELRARLVKAVPDQPVEVVVVEKELTIDNLKQSGDTVLSAIADMMVEQPVTEPEAEEPLTSDEMVKAILTIEPPKDILKVIQDRTSKPILSVSRVRVAQAVQPDQTPVFWSSFVTKLRRPEVIDLSSVDFESRNGDLARGYHKCTVDGVAGVLHVTKSNVSAVLHMGGDEFNGISTSASRFNGKGLVNLNHEQAKNFLTGR